MFSSGIMSETAVVLAAEGRRAPEIVVLDADVSPVLKSATDLLLEFSYWFITQRKAQLGVRGLYALLAKIKVVNWNTKTIFVNNRAIPCDLEVNMDSTRLLFKAARTINGIRVCNAH
jgi:hypothetical protein